MARGARRRIGPSDADRGRAGKTETTPDVEHAAFAAKAMKESGAIALIAPDPVQIVGLEPAPILFPVIGLKRRGR